MQSPGCVVPTTPTLTYHLAYNGELARHISLALGSGLRGGTGSPLTRLVDTALQAKNRSIACPRRYPRPTGKSCDEYPFASTYQGAASGGVPRTFSKCGISAVAQGATGPKGYSVCMIDETKNSSGGSQLGLFYNDNRVLANDSFTVAVAP